MADPTDRDRVVPLRPAAAPGAPLADLAGRPRGVERVKAILSQRDPERIVTEMPVGELYYLIKEVGLADAQEIFELATPEQMQGFFDLDIWTGDRLSDADTRPLLQALLEAGPEKLTEVWRGLDQELTALILQRWTRIYNIKEEEVPDDEEPPFYPTPDRFFMVKITAEDDNDVRLVERLLDYLYRVDQPQARHTIRQAMSEPGPELEEMAYRWRSGRMADMGYADYGEALQVYVPLEPTKIAIGENTADEPSEPQRLPAPLASQATTSGFLGRVLATITDVDEATRLETALVMLWNRVLAADRVQPGDIAGAVAGATRAAATLSLGLETLARGDIERGAQALASVSLTRLHRLGHTVGLQLGKLVAALGARAARADEPYSSIATSLRGQRPMFPRVLDTPPAAGTRPIASAADVLRATGALTSLAAQVVLVHDVIGADPIAVGEAVTLGDVGRTAVARAALGQAATATPLRLADVVALGQLITNAETGPRVQQAFAVRAAERGVRVPPECPPVLDGWIADLAAGALKRGDAVVLDRRFVEGLLLQD